ncbi:MAG: tetratricopeptide repeat protein, partial [Flavobacteriaceae bacterium]
MSAELNNKGLLYYNQGKYDLALDFFLQALNQEPANSIYLVNVGNTYHALKRYEKAQIYFKKILEIKPDDASALKLIGNTFFALQDFPQAIEFFQKGLALEPNDALNYGYLGDAFYQRGIFIKAADCYQRALRIQPSHENHNLLGVCYFKLFDYERAIECFQKAIQLNATHPDYPKSLDAAIQSKSDLEAKKSADEIEAMKLNEIANSYIKDADYLKSSEFFRKALDANPADVIIQKNAAIAFYHLKDYKNAIPHLSKVIEINAADHDSVNMLGLCYFYLKEYEKAKEHYEKAIALDPANAVYKQNLQIAQNDQSLHMNRGASAIKELNELNSQGVDLFNKGDYVQAIEYYKKALQVDDRDAIVYYNIANAYFSLENYDECIIYSEESVKIDTNKTEAYNLIATSYQKKNDINKAIEIFKKTLDIKPHPDTYNNLGNCYFLQKDYEPAILNFTKAVELDPDNKLYKNNLNIASDTHKKYAGLGSQKIDEVTELTQRALNAHDQHNFQEAIELFKKVIALNPNDVSVYHNIGSCYFNQKLYHEAIEYYQKAIEIDPDNASSQLLIGNTYLELGNYQNAISHYQRSNELDPKNHQALSSLGFCYYQASDFQKAIAYYQNAISSGGSNANNFNHLGFCHHKLNVFEKAVENFQKAVELEPNNATYKENLRIAMEERIKFDEIFSELDKLVGLDNIKDDINSLIKYVRVEKMREEQGLGRSSMSLHTVFYGPPGTGKTTVARLLGKIFKAVGIVSSGHLVEADRSALVAGFMGQTAEKTTQVVQQSLNGVLFIDEAYTLNPDGNSQDFGREAIDSLLKHMEDYRDNLVVIVAGYTEPMRLFLGTNPGLQSRFKRSFYFQDYLPSELLEIFHIFCRKGSFTLEETAIPKLERYFEHVYRIRDENFGNARLVRNTFEDIVKTQAVRVADMGFITPQALTSLTLQDVEGALDPIFEEQQEDNLDNVLQDLDLLIGLDSVKNEVRALINFIQVDKLRSEKGLAHSRPSLHYIFQGSPGTGKTTVARLMGRIFKAMGILGKGHVVEVERSQLIGEHIGTTAPKTNKVIDRAIHGILFIDEAYTLSSSSQQDFGSEAIATILKRMEDDRANLIVIAAGYQ